MVRRRSRRPASRRPVEEPEPEWDEEAERREELTRLRRKATREHAHMQEAGLEAEYPLLQTVPLPVPVFSGTGFKDSVELRYPTALDEQRATADAIEKIKDDGDIPTAHLVEMTMGPILMSRLSGLGVDVILEMNPQNLRAIGEAIKLFGPSSPEQDEL